MANNIKKEKPVRPERSSVKLLPRNNSNSNNSNTSNIPPLSPKITTPPTSPKQTTPSSPKQTTPSSPRQIVPTSPKPIPPQDRLLSKSFSGSEKKGSFSNSPSERCAEILALMKGKPMPPLPPKPSGEKKCEECKKPINTKDCIRFKKKKNIIIVVSHVQIVELK